MNPPRITFGDKVRIRSAAVTDAMGVTGQTGIVYGGTTPSVTRVEVIGDISDDHAIAVKIEGRAESLWFAENLLEFIDHQSGMTMSIAGRHFVRDEHGEWHEAEQN
jgi:hypothetical protein